MRTFFESIGAAGAVIVGLIGAVVLAGVLALFWLNFFAKPIANAQYQVTVHTQAYVQSHQATMLNYYADWLSGDPAHKAAAVQEICGESILLDPTEWPANLQSFIAQNCH